MRTAAPMRRDMPREITVSIEPRLVAGIVEALLTIYSAQADALRHATDGHLASAVTFDDVDHARRQLWAVEAALDGLGWTAGERPHAAELSGSPQLIHETLTSAVIAAAEHLAETCREYTRARADLGAVGEAYSRLAALHAVFAVHEDRHAV
jgi:hypothetical protein